MMSLRDIESIRGSCRPSCTRRDDRPRGSVAPRRIAATPSRDMSRVLRRPALASALRRQVARRPHARVHVYT